MKKSILRFSFISLVLLNLASCDTNITPFPDEKADLVTFDDRVQTELGSSTVNPFTIENVREALRRIEKKRSAEGKRLNCINCDLSLGPTHKYVKFMPQDLDQMVALEKRGYVLWDVPLDQDLGLVGDFYHDPAVGPDGITYFYTLVPIQQTISSSVPYEIVSEVFLFNEDDGDIKDEDEVDPWDPNICYDEFGQAYICGGLRVKAVNNTVKATNQLNEMGVDKIEFYNILMHISGNSDEMIENVDFEKNRISSVSGNIKVRDNSINVDVPLRGVLVRTRRWFKLSQTFTSSNGNFNIPKTYRKKATVSIHFNDGDKIRGINNLWKFYQFVLPVCKTLGEFNVDQLNSINYVFQYNPDPNSNAATQWVAAHTWNTIKDHPFKNSFYGVNYVADSHNIWISSRVTSANGSAPMLRTIANTSLISAGIDMFLANVSGSMAVAAKRIIQNLLPDITLRYGSSSSQTMLTKDIVETIYHEMGHSTHFTHVGNAYWTDFIAYIVSNNGYGTKNTIGIGRIAVAEGWGFFVGKLYSSKYYEGFAANSAAQSLRDVYLSQLELRKPSDPNEYYNWIPFGMFYDLIDSGEPSSTLVIDNVNGYTPGMIFQSIGANVLTIGQFKTDLLGRHGNIQSPQVNQLVQSYGY